jgi:hypothetical protein
MMNLWKLVVPPPQVVSDFNFSISSVEPLFNGSPTFHKNVVLARASPWSNNVKEHLNCLVNNLSWFGLQGNTEHRKGKIL